MINLAETFTSGILTPIVLLFLSVCGAAVFVYAGPSKAVFRYLKGKRGSGKESLSAMTTALAGTLGVGNISGVALAIAFGGCGAVFWMWISALFAMTVKYAEILLASHYRIRKMDGYHGGAPLYMRTAFKGKTGKIISAVFSVLCIIAALTVGSSVQSLAAAETAQAAFGIPPIITGIILAFGSALCIFGGNKRIEKVTELLVPVMSAAYLVLSSYIIIREASKLPQIFTQIIRSAFSFRSAAGGIGGYGAISAARYGVSRGLISNEAGCGTAPFAHSRADREPAEQGIFGILEVFIDTVLLCTVTALCIIAVYGENVPKDTGGMILVIHAFDKHLGSFAPAALCVSVLLFAFGSIICWYYYGTECLGLSGAKKGSIPVFTLLFLFSTVYGTVSRGGVWLLSDICIDMMLAINTAAIIKEIKTVKIVTDRYISSLSNSSSERADSAIFISSFGKARAIPHSETEAP